LEPILMKHLYKTHGRKTIKAPIIPQEKPKPVDKNDKKKLPDENTWLWEAFDELIREMERAILPLDEYVKTFAAFEKENALNPDKYVKEKDNLENPCTPQELRADIYENMKKEEQIKQLIPESVNVSMFMINCKEIRQHYAGKFQQIVDKEIKLIQQKAKDETMKLQAKFGEITARINTIPKNIDELTDTKKYISEIGVQIEKLKREIDETMKTYQILEEFNVELTTLEFNNKWELFKAPKNVQKVIEVQNEVLNKLKEQMLKTMELEQEEFDENIENLAQMIGSFGSFDNLEKYQEIAMNVDNIEEKLMESDELARLFNQREFLVGKELRDYSRLATMKKDF
jgi:dynein heavy chain